MAEYGESVEGVLKWKGEDVGRCGESGGLVVVSFGKTAKLTEVLRCWMIWHGCTDKNLSWWCVRSWDEIQMVLWTMRNESKVVNELYIKRVLSVLEDFLFFSLYWFSWISKASHDFETGSTPGLSWFPRYEFRVLFVWFVISHLSFQYHLRSTPPSTLKRVLQHRTWYWMCLHPLTGCKYWSEHCFVSCWV